MPSEPRYFIPVCLYPHTKYRTAAGVRTLFDKYALRDHDHLIVVADRLLVLDRLVTGRYWTVSSAVNKAKHEAKQILSLISRVSKGAGAQARGTVVCWDEIAETAQYSDFAQRLQHAILSDQLLTETIQAFVERRVGRYGLGASPEREQGYELEYLLSEVSMSVFCTEMLGFPDEVWERPPPADVPDPLKWLYGKRHELVTRLTGRPATRVLTFLFPDASNGAKETNEERHPES
jgi:tRNA-dependent cyclodipeptide synthase